MTRDAAAQWNLERFGTERSRVYAAYGLDPAWVASLGYARVIELVGRDVQMVGDLGVATAGADARDFRVRLGARSSVVRRGSIHLAASATFITRGTENVVYRGLNFGADVTGSVGVYRNRWFAAGELGKDKAIVTRVTHTEWYRENYHPEAKDGWYVDAGGTYHYGLTGGLTLGGVQVMARFGWMQTEDFNEVMPPMYASLGLGLGL